MDTNPEVVFGIDPNPAVLASPLRADRGEIVDFFRRHPVDLSRKCDDPTMVTDFSDLHIETMRIIALSSEVEHWKEIAEASKLKALSLDQDLAAALKKLDAIESIDANVAAMTGALSDASKALEACITFMDDFVPPPQAREDAVLAFRKCKEALSSKTRNCDRFRTGDRKADAHAAYNRFLAEGNPRETPFEWLLGETTEKKEEAK